MSLDSVVYIVESASYHAEDRRSLPWASRPPRGSPAHEANSL